MILQSTGCNIVDTWYSQC